MVDIHEYSQTRLKEAIEKNDKKSLTHISFLVKDAEDVIRSIYKSTGLVTMIKATKPTDQGDICNLQILNGD